MDELFGLPAHPLVVHGAVVLVPLAALGTVLIAVSAKLRAQMGIAVAVLAVVAFGFTLLAKQSGEPLEERIDETEAVEEHAEMGEVAPLSAGLLMLTSVGLVGMDRYRRRAEGGDGADEGPATAASNAAGAPSWLTPAATGVAVLAVLSSLAATTQIVLVGHSGAQATWEEEVGGGEGGEGEEREHDDDGEDEEGMGVPVVLEIPLPDAVPGS